MPTFVQFIHPGAEHGPDRDGRKGWNWGDHRRKFLRARGNYVVALGSSAAEADLVFWGEWEPESEVEQIENRVPGGPRWLHTPYYVKPDAYRVDNRVRQNTDPFVFGDRFLYTLCRQVKRSGRPTMLRDLDPGSVIVFGSLKAGEFVVDTVFVTGPSTLHSLDSWPDEVGSRVSETYADVTLRPTYGWENPDFQLRLYEGASLQEPFDGMFSYVPARPREVAPGGFARPAVRHEELITPSLPMGFKATHLSAGAIRFAWEGITEQIIGHDLVLATTLALPEKRAEAA